MQPIKEGVSCLQIGKYNYNRVSPSMLCPVCKRKSYCLISDNGDFVICTKVESSKPYKAYNGWLHYGGTYTPPARIKRSQDYSADVTYVQYMYKELDFTKEALMPLADQLGVPVRTLQRLSAGFNGSDWQFPMYDQFKQLTGLKRRNLTGDKWCLKKSRLGVYIPTKTDLDKPVVIAEGESDTAALLSQCYNVIGRPSAEGGLYILEKLLVNTPGVTIVVDNDKHNAGKNGALKLKERLTCPVSLVYIKDHKDIRQWINSGTFTRTKFNKLKQKE